MVVDLFFFGLVAFTRKRKVEGERKQCSTQ